MYVMSVVKDGKYGSATRFNVSHNPNIKVGDFIKSKTLIYKVISIVHENVRTVLYVIHSSIEEVLAGA